jgi:hypothetical protein
MDPWAPVAVVSPQFCAPRTVPLTVTKMAMSFSGGDFTVTGADGAVVLRVEGVCFSVGRRRVLHDAAGRPILTMQRKVIINVPVLSIFCSFCGLHACEFPRMNV